VNNARRDAVGKQNIANQFHPICISYCSYYLNNASQCSRKHRFEISPGLRQLVGHQAGSQELPVVALSFVGTGWVHNTGTKMRQPSSPEPVQVLFGRHWSPAVSWSSVRWEPGLSQGWADKVRQNKHGWSDEMQEKAEKLLGLLKHWALVSPG